MTAVAPESVPVQGEKIRPRWKRLFVGALVIVVIGAFANLVGWDLRGWFHDVWKTITSISAAYLVAAVVLKTLQTSLTAFAWFSILRFAYPGRVRWREVLACYAASVALNGILPANLGTLALLLMFTATIAGATFAAILGAYAVEKIFFTVIGIFVYLYLFLTISGSFDIKFNFVHTHPWATAIFLLGGAFIVFLVLRRFWPRVVHWWQDAKEGGAILASPRKYLGWVFLPSFLSWVASLGVMAVFMSAYSIPVTFDTLMHLCGGNSIANMTSVTPGGAGVNQAFNVASLNGVTDATTATAYSVAQQLVTTAWNIVFAIIMMVAVFGWTGGKALVEDSYAGAKQKAAEQKAAHDARKQAKKEAEAEAV
jgi:glycosyltransferase 2 family protein